jgi:hypothetical protein
LEGLFYRDPLYVRILRPKVKEPTIHSISFVEQALKPVEPEAPHLDEIPAIIND